MLTNFVNTLIKINISFDYDLTTDKIEQLVIKLNSAKVL